MTYSLDLQQITDLFWQGQTIDEIANQLYVSDWTIRRRLRLLGLIKSGYGHKINNYIRRREIYVERCNKIANLIELGCTYKQIQHRLGLKSRDLIWKIKSQRFPGLKNKQGKLVDYSAEL